MSLYYVNELSKVLFKLSNNILSNSKQKEDQINIYIVCVVVTTLMLDTYQTLSYYRPVELCRSVPVIDCN